MRRGGKRFLSLHPAEDVPVIITDWVAMGVRDADHLNNEMVELALNTAFTGVPSHDLTGYTLENRAGHTYAFPSGFRIFAGATSACTPASGRTRTAYSTGGARTKRGQQGDCVTLRAPDRTLVNRFQFYADCSP